MDIEPSDIHCAQGYNKRSPQSCTEMGCTAELHRCDSWYGCGADGHVLARLDARRRRRPRSRGPRSGGAVDLCCGFGGVELRRRLVLRLWLPQVVRLLGLDVLRAAGWRAVPPRFAHVGAALLGELRQAVRLRPYLAGVGCRRW